MGQHEPESAGQYAPESGGQYGRNSHIADKNNAIQHFSNIENEIAKLIETKNDFTAFVILALGIEFIGVFLDGKDFDAGKSEFRFTNGLDEFKNKWYHTNRKLVFKHFRGPLVHQLRPSDQIILTSICKNNANPEEHLKKTDETYTFVLEVLFQDFKEAVTRLKTKLSKKNSPLNKIKPESDFISKNDQGASAGTKSNQTKEAESKR